ncbi:NAD(P)-dependent oxidoreductase [Vibrio ponticus]|uniref:NAD(P)-dependent oxidoreductase n=1 Tax=Vibrio ponticus TaxID=265668 RepID=A0ABX3FN55_9VIBR|nr:NAD-dependent epimerase/dehydratase family protein [Vibrio ponticus]OLQ95190.1 NAD(P)-dependent oxidoreductase [Vibrio ponticus]
MKRIGIVGGGWLGLPLSKFLANLGHAVVVTKTSLEGAQHIDCDEVPATVVDLSQGESHVVTALAPFQPQILIGCFPPGFRRGNGDEYAHYWQTLVAAAERLAVEKIVMVSSTTVYPNRAESMSEEMASLVLTQDCDDFSANAKVMLHAEQCLIDSGIDYAVVRCSGLVGPERNPARFVTHLKQVSDQAPANMLHLTDAIGAVSYAALHIDNQVVNATTPNTTSKAEFYQAAIDRSGLALSLPALVHHADKHISADKLVELGYKFHFQHTLEII